MLIVYHLMVERGREVEFGWWEFDGVISSYVWYDLQVSPIDTISMIQSLFPFRLFSALIFFTDLVVKSSKIRSGPFSS